MTSAPPLIADVRFTAAAARSRGDEGGLLGWISVTLAGVVHVDGIALKRAPAGSGDLLLSWPSRRSSSGRVHAVALPVLARREEVNRQILDQARAILASLADRGIKRTESAP